MMLIIENRIDPKNVILTQSERYKLKFIPVCEFFEQSHRLYLKGSKIVKIDFESYYLSGDKEGKIILL